METLRSALARCCKILGFDQQTCLALTLMLDSKEALMTMLWAMKEIEDRGLVKKVRDMTTLIVNIAVQIEEKEAEKQRERAKD